MLARHPEGDQSEPDIRAGGLFVYKWKSLHAQTEHRRQNPLEFPEEVEKPARKGKLYGHEKAESDGEGVHGYWQPSDSIEGLFGEILTDVQGAL